MYLKDAYRKTRKKGGMNMAKKKTTFKEALIYFLKQQGFLVEERSYGIFVKSGIDSWLIRVGTRADADLKHHVTLYHGDVFKIQPENSVKLGNFPDMHLQFSKPCSVSYLVNYISRHENKYHDGKTLGQKWREYKEKLQQDSYQKLF